jgi:hypothetical protein
VLVKRTLRQPWTMLTTPVSYPYVSIPNVRTGQNYQLQARVISLWGVPSPYDTAAHVVGTLSWTPDNPLNLTVTPHWRSFELHWDAVANARQYEVRNSATDQWGDGVSQLRILAVKFFVQ